MKYLLDTSWIIMHLRGATSYTRAIRQIGKDKIGVSIVSVAKLHEGVARAKDPKVAKSSLDTFLADKTIVQITSETCRIFGEEKARLRRDNLLEGDFDTLIAAACLQHGSVLLTTNREHFKRFPGLLIIEDPEDIKEAGEGAT